MTRFIQNSFHFIFIFIFPLLLCVPVSRSNIPLGLSTLTQPYSDCRSTSQTSSISPLFTCIDHVQVHFNSSQHPKTLRTIIRLMIQTFYVFVLPLINSTLLLSISLMFNPTFEIYILCCTHQYIYSLTCAYLYVFLPEGLMQKSATKNIHIF